MAKKNRLNDPRSSSLNLGPSPGETPAPIAKVAAAPGGDSSTLAGRDDVAAGVSGPAPRVALLLSGAIALHFFLILASYLAVVRPSGLQAQLVNGFAAYLRTGHWMPEPGAADAEAATEGVAFFLARGDGLERSYRLQFAKISEGSDETEAPANEAVGETDTADAEWYDAPIARGVAGGERGRRHARYLAAVAALGLSDQNELAARLLQPIARAYPEVDRVRVIRLPNLMTNVVQDAESAPYAATLIREGEVTRFVREPAPRLRAEAIR